MKVAIMQPYFFPYAGYFSLIHSVDLFVVFDIVQFPRHGWVDRNRILKPSLDGWQYFRPAVHKVHRGTLIRDVALNSSIDWQSRVVGQLSHYSRFAPHFHGTMGVVEATIRSSHSRLPDLNLSGIQNVCRYLGIETQITTLTSLGIDLQSVRAPDEWSLRICQELPGVQTYINASGGKSFFDTSKFHCAGIELKFLAPELEPYSQNTESFISGLSIVDLLMSVGPVDALQSIRSYALE